MSKPRAHLVERAAEALGLVPPAVPTAAEAPAAPAMPAVAEAAALSSAEKARGTDAPLPSSSEAPARPASGLAPPRVTVTDEALRSAGLVVGMAIGKRSRVSEEISLVQHQTLQTLRNAEPVDGRCDRILLVTSALPGEGKTFISLNLAASLAASGRAPVLLVDTDGKAGSVSQLLGADEEPGLRALASGEMTQRIDSFLLPTAQPQLFVLPYGKASVAHAKAPPGEMMAATVLRLSRALPDHIIVLDSPPCLSVSDPSSLAAIAGQVLMVVQAERTKRAELEAALDLVDSCPTLQLVLNQTRQVGTDSFGAYGDYGAHHRSVASDA